MGFNKFTTKTYLFLFCLFVFSLFSLWAQCRLSEFLFELWVFNQTSKGASTLNSANGLKKGQKTKNNTFHLHDVGHCFHYTKLFLFFLYFCLVLWNSNHIRLFIIFYFVILLLNSTFNALWLEIYIVRYLVFIEIFCDL